MRFGMSEQEAAAQPKRSGGGGGFMKRPQEGENVWRIVDEPAQWVYFYEHFNPTGFSFPCHPDRSICEGCNSDNPKMKKASEKVAFNVWDGEYTNVVKVPRMSVADKLKTRAERAGTIRDRDYIIRQTKNARGTDYDVEGLDKEKFDFSSVEEHVRTADQISEMLGEAYEEQWGTSTKVATARDKAVQRQFENDAPARPKIKREEPTQEVISEGTLRKMDVFDLADLCKREGFGDIPAGTDTADEIVDWMLQQA